MSNILIENYIPEGYKNRIKRYELVQKVGVTDREVRHLIRQAVDYRNVMILNVGNGYFIPLPTDRAEMRKYRDREVKKAVSILQKTKRLEKMLNFDKDQIVLDEFVGRLVPFEEK